MGVIRTDAAIAKELQSCGFTGAYIRISNAKISKLEYVIPDISSKKDHVVWFSEIYKPIMPGRIEDAGFICGTLLDQAFFHCHGLYKDANGKTLMGHLLSEKSILSSSTHVTGFGFADANFNRKRDLQTGFDLLFPEQIMTAPINPDAILLKISPNIDINETLIEACKNAGWAKASVHGVGSLIGVEFADGRVMNNFATEVMITNGIVDFDGKFPLVSLEVSAVDSDGNIMQGILASTGNSVLITFELILKNEKKGDREDKT